MRANQRNPEQLRNLVFETDFIEHPEGSCLTKMGKTWVLSNASIEEKVHSFLRDKGKVGLRLNTRCFLEALIPEVHEKPLKVNNREEPKNTKANWSISSSMH